MKKGIRRFLGTVILILTVAAMPFEGIAGLQGVFSLQAEAAETVQAVVSGTYDQTGARSMLSMINEFRTGSDAWYWNSSDTEKIYFNDLSELTYDYALEEVAMLRAAEIATTFSHTRPNGTSCFTAYPGEYFYYSKGENIAAGYRTVAAVFEGWQETNDDYSGQGHRRNMLSSSFTSVGIACIKVGNTYFWVQEFGRPNSGAAASSANNSFTDVSVSISTTMFTISPSASTAEISIKKGESADLPKVTATLSSGNTWPSGSIKVGLEPAWSSSDSSVAKISGNKVVGAGAGTAVLNAAVGDQTLSIPVTVSGPAVSAAVSASADSAESRTKVVLSAGAEGGSGSYTYKFTVRDASGGSEYTIQDYSAASSCTWTTGAAGNKVITLYVKDSQGAQASAEMNFTVKTPTTAPLNGTLDAGKTSAASGEKVTLTARASGGTGSYTYKFLIYDNGSQKWFLLRDFGTSNQCVWTPGALGTKTLFTDIKDSAGNQTRVKISGFTVTEKKAELAGSLKASLASDGSGASVAAAVSGTKVRLTAAASNGTSPYTYKFLIYDNGSAKWYMLKDYSSSNTCTWTPGAVGTKTLFVDIKDAAGGYVRIKLSNFKVTSK